MAVRVLLLFHARPTPTAWLTSLVAGCGLSGPTFQSLSSPLAIFTGCLAVTGFTFRRFAENEQIIINIMLDCPDPKNYGLFFEDHRFTSNHGLITQMLQVDIAILHALL